MLRRQAGKDPRPDHNEMAEARLDQAEKLWKQARRSLQTTPFAPMTHCPFDEKAVSVAPHVRAAPHYSGWTETIHSNSRA